MVLTPLDPWIARKVGASHLTRDALAAYQLVRLHETLAWVGTHSRFYRDHLAGAPLCPETLADIARLPFTTAADIQEDPLRFVCVSQGEIARVVTLDTSGTTGNRKRCYFTLADQELTIEFFRVGMSTFTVPGDRVSILLPCTRPGSVGELLARALMQMNAEGVKHGPVSDIGAALDVLARERVTGLVGMPAQVLALARFPEQPDRLSLRFALLTTDHVPQAIVTAVERAWGCTVYNHYGMTEMGLGGGVECRARRGYHMREADLYVEIVDPRTGQPLPDGMKGEIVFTTLTRQGMPLIRYRTGDAGHFIPGPCPCGTALRTLARVTHRLESTVALATGDVLTLPELDEALFALEGVVDFAVSFTPGDPDRLATTLAGHRGREMPGEARTALMGLPVIAQAVADGTLRLDVAATSAIPPSPAKRTFNDKRVR